MNPTPSPYTIIQTLIVTSHESNAYLCLYGKVIRIAHIQWVHAM